MCIHSLRSQTEAVQSCRVQEREAKRQKLKQEGATAFIGADAGATSSRDAEEPVRPKVRP